MLRNVAFVVGYAAFLILFTMLERAPANTKALAMYENITDTLAGDTFKGQLV